MIIPYQKLEADVLRAIAEEYVSREGTDYGEVELSLAEKTEQLLQKIRREEVLVVFDAAQESINLLSKDDLPDDL